MADSKKIAKNTIALYLRMIVTMAIGFYSSRVVLEQLGVDGYGVYNVVGGIVVLVSFINNAMLTSTQRYINYAKGQNDFEQIRKVFATSLSIHLLIALAITIITEAFGPWILNEYLNIPKHLLGQANWVYQFSVAAFVLNIITSPHLAMIVAYERMSVFAWTSIVESMLKLGSAVILIWIAKDKLAYYGLFVLIATLVGRYIYVYYCKRNFPELRKLKLALEKALGKEMLSFSGWSVVGSLGYILHTQGIALVLNLFFNSAVNAAQGIANQVNGLLSSFVSNFVLALSPQIVQTYASGKYEEMHRLIYRGCRLTLFLSSIFVVPVIIGARGLLNIWLTVVPDHTISFVVIVLVITLINSFTTILSTAQNATGNIKKYQIILTGIGLLHIPLTIVAFVLKGSPDWAVYIYLLLTVAMQIFRIEYVCRAVNLSTRYFYISIVIRSAFAIAAGIILPLILNKTFPDKTIYVLVNVVITMLCVGVSYAFIALAADERKLLVQFVKSKIKHV